MLNNYIGGGQVFLHKIRMFIQVFFRSLYLSLFTGIIVTLCLNWSDISKADWHGFYSYKKAELAISWQGSLNPHKKPYYINARSKGKIWRNIPAHKVLKMKSFKLANSQGWQIINNSLILAICFASLSFIFIFYLWSKFGRTLKGEKIQDNSGKILTDKEISRKLRTLKLASSFQIGKMPLVKDMETRHFLITGSTGSGKTNFMHNLLPQIESKQQAAIIIDQTGEMIAKYYDKNRGDIIFNPFDERGVAWDFWHDVSSQEDLELFSNILFSFNRKKHGYSSDPFWEKSAETIFISCCQYLVSTNNKKLDELNKLTSKSSLQDLSEKLQGTNAERFLSSNNSITASSIIATLATSTKPLNHLSDERKNGKFALKEYFAGVKEGRNSWLFLSTKPSNRDLTLPIISCLTELSLSMLMDIGINQDRRIWFILDELAALGRLPALGKIMVEGRKYGACVLAGLQSLNQIYASYGQHDGNTIFSQFASKFFFRTDDPIMGKMISSLCGSKTIIKQQKNTSFGANTYRDGQSYTEQERSKNLVEYSDLTKLDIGECYALLPEPSTRLAKIQIPKQDHPNKNLGFKPINKEKKNNLQNDFLGLIKEESSTKSKPNEKIYTNKNKELDNPLIAEEFNLHKEP